MPVYSQRYYVAIKFYLKYFIGQRAKKQKELRVEIKSVACAWIKYLLHKCGENENFPKFRILMLSILVALLLKKLPP